MVAEREQKKEDKTILHDILSVSGHAGLFKFIAQARNGIIIESLETGKRIQAFATMQISYLKNIAIYTDEEEISLDKVLKKIYDKENGGKAIDHKSQSDLIKKYFGEILPEYDRERVYVSDIKKVLNWYNILQKLSLLKFEEEGEKDAKEEGEEQEEDRKEQKKKVSKTGGKEIKPDKNDPK